MKRLLMLWIAMSLTVVSAEDGPTYIPDDNKVIQTNAHGQLPVELHEALAERQAEKWARVEEQTGHELSYSYVFICDEAGKCMKVDPVSRIR
jgi:hypothetical protein